MSMYPAESQVGCGRDYDTVRVNEPPVKENADQLQATISRLHSAVSQAEERFGAVLAQSETLGSKSRGEVPMPPHPGTSQLASTLIAATSAVEEAIMRIHQLIHRCEL